MYKSIMLSNREHTREVVCSAMLKHGLEGSPEDFNLFQMLPDKGKQSQRERVREKEIYGVYKRKNMAKYGRFSLRYILYTSKNYIMIKSIQMFLFEIVWYFRIPLHGIKPTSFKYVFCLCAKSELLFEILSNGRVFSSLTLLTFFWHWFKPVHVADGHLTSQKIPQTQTAGHFVDGLYWILSLQLCVIPPPQEDMVKQIFFYTL